MLARQKDEANELDDIAPSGSIQIEVALADHKDQSMKRIHFTEDQIIGGF
jgi:hypothetical protein